MSTLALRVEGDFPLRRSLGGLPAFWVAAVDLIGNQAASEARVPTAQEGGPR